MARTPLKPNGGGMADSKDRYEEYRGVINPILEKTSDTKLNVTANRVGNKIDIKAEVSGLKDPDEKKRLRLVLVEENYPLCRRQQAALSPSRRPRFAGAAPRASLSRKPIRNIPPRSTWMSCAPSSSSIWTPTPRKRAPSRYPDRPLDFKHLKVIGLVQDDASKEIVQVMEVDVGGGNDHPARQSQVIVDSSNTGGNRETAVIRGASYHLVRGSLFARPPLIHRPGRHASCTLDCRP